MEKYKWILSAICFAVMIIIIYAVGVTSAFKKGDVLPLIIVIGLIILFIYALIKKRED